jgi:hypothetical protein
MKIRFKNIRWQERKDREAVVVESRALGKELIL